MIAGMPSSGIATAIRTAGEARQRMDTAARQIATGQRVASAKDDGAAYARAAEMRGRLAQNEARTTITSLLRDVANVATVRYEAQLKAADTMRGALLTAMQHPAGSAARQAAAADYQAALDAFTRLDEPPTVIVSGWGGHPNGVWGIGASTADPVLAGMGIASEFDNDVSVWLQPGYYPGGTTAPNAVDVVNGTAASLQSAATNITTVLMGSVITSKAQHSGMNHVWLDSVDDYTSADTGRTEAVIASLTAADLGKASTRLRQNETRQQLALQTVRQALDAYGAYAGGLLGNVQRSQRSVLA
jgi:flagellin